MRRWYTMEYVDGSVSKTCDFLRQHVRPTTRGLKQTTHMLKLYNP